MSTDVKLPDWWPGSPPAPEPDPEPEPGILAKLAAVFGGDRDGDG